MVVKLVVMERREKKALENPGADRIMASLGAARSGLPYFAFLDETGKKIADSNVMPGGKNIGYPASPAEIAAFRKLLKETAPRLTDEQLDRLAAYLPKLATH